MFSPRTSEKSWVLWPFFFSSFELCFTISPKVYKTQAISTNPTKPLQRALHNANCFTAPRFPIRSGMMSSSQDKEQESHYFLLSAVMLTYVKPGDAGNETREHYRWGCACVCVCLCLEISSFTENI